jgi:hypothetical protein
MGGLFCGCYNCFTKKGIVNPLSATFPQGKVKAFILSAIYK